LAPASASPAFVRGDTDASGDVDLTDAVTILGYAFLGTAAPSCMKSADVNDNGVAAELSDAVYILSFKFAGSSPPAPPFPDCGVEPVESTLSCDAFDPCASSTGPSEAEALVEIENAFVSDVSPELAISVPGVIVGEPIEAHVSGLGSAAPATLVWGDGSTTPVDADGVYTHTYDHERDALVWLVDAAGSLHGTALVEVVPGLEIVAVEIVSLAPEGMGAGAGIARGPVDGPSFPLDPSLEAPVLLPPGFEDEPFFPQGLPAPQLGVRIETRGEGILNFGPQLLLPDGFPMPLPGAQVPRFPGDPTLELPLPPLPTDFPGPLTLWVDLQTGPGSAGILSVPSAFPVLPPLDPQAQDPCERARIAYQTTCGFLTVKKINCEALRQALARAEAELADAEAELGDAKTELGDAEDALADAHEKATDLENEIEDKLGGTGTLKSRDEVTSGENFIGNGSFGVAFGSATALLVLSDSVAAANNGTSLLAMVNELGQLKKDLEARTQAHTQAQARVAGLEHRVSGLEAQVEDLRRALAACEDRVGVLEDQKEQLEQDWEECLEELIVKGSFEEPVYFTAFLLHLTQLLLRGLEEDAQGASEAAGEESETPDSPEEPRAQIQAAVDQTILATLAMHQAHRKLDQARQAFVAGQTQQAFQLAAEAQECATQARRHQQAARDILDGVFLAGLAR